MYFVLIFTLYCLLGHNRDTLEVGIKAYLVNKNELIDERFVILTTLELEDRDLLEEISHTLSHMATLPGRTWKCSCDVRK